MSKRRLWLGLGGLTVLGAAAVLLWPAAPPAGISRFSCLRIRAGMSPEQVEAVVGCPPGDYRAAPQAICEMWLHQPGETHTDWYSDQGHLRIVFADDRFVIAYWWPYRSTVADWLLQPFGIGGAMR